VMDILEKTGNNRYQYRPIDYKIKWLESLERVSQTE
jgi:hypothetical protein